MFEIHHRQSVFDTSKEEMSAFGGNRSTSSLGSKSSLVAEAELSKIQNSNRILGNLIKNTQQRVMRRNMVKKSDSKT